MHDQQITRHVTQRVPGTTHYSLVWLLWLVAGIVAVSANPLLNLLVIAQAVLVALTCHSDSPVGHAFGLFVRLGAALVVARTLLSAIPIGGYSYGTTALITLPDIALPIWLGGLRVGGVATLEMLIGGLVGGIRLWALILVFGAFNAVADHYALLRRTPRWLFHAGLATTIALTFVPQVITQLQTTRDAQRVRGHRFRSWRDALPLLVPVLSGGLERSIQLAEAMDSRGYGRTIRLQHGAVRGQLVLIAGLTVLALGVYFGFTGDARGWIGVGIGLAIIGWVLRWQGRGIVRTRYLQERWHDRDTLMALACVILIAGITVLRLHGSSGLLYTPLPRVTLPRFEPVAGALTLLLSVPAIVQLRSVEVPHDRSSKLRHSRVADRI